jgi:hypothetical protein
MTALGATNPFATWFAGLLSNFIAFLFCQHFNGYLEGARWSLLCPWGLLIPRPGRFHQHSNVPFMASRKRAEKRVHVLCVVHNGAFGRGGGYVVSRITWSIWEDVRFMYD